MKKDESEETEVKNIEWAKKEIKKIHTLTFEAYEAAVIANNKHFQMKNSEQLAFINKVLEIINQLDEPEVLSQELPVIPQFVAEYLDFAKSDVPLMRVMELAKTRNEWPKWEKEYDWISANDEKFARAWLDGYTVEEEQKYVVPVGENHALCKFTNDAWGIYKEDIDKLYLDDDFKFTEQEIKDHDPRYLAFKVKVEGLEE